ncbi:MAG TPA: hypothetical protein VMV01_17435, partial [Planctomycetota bacterium]|nr:hypothetical protein [Planctomycetota bacterium]
MDRWERIEALYEEALPLGPEERFALLARNCGDDDALRAELEAMLAAAERPLSVERLVPAEGSGPDPLVGVEVGRWRV